MTVKLNVPLIIFREGSTVIAFCPVLDLSGYGKTEREAKESFEIVVSEFLDYTTKKRTLDKELKKLGWSVSKNAKKASPPDWCKVTDKSIFEKDFKKVHQPILMPA